MIFKQGLFVKHACPPYGLSVVVAAIVQICFFVIVNGGGSDLIINRGHLPVMTNVNMKFSDPRPKRS